MGLALCPNWRRRVHPIQAPIRVGRGSRFRAGSVSDGGHVRNISDRGRIRCIINWLAGGRSLELLRVRETSRPSLSAGRRFSAGWRLPARRRLAAAGNVTRRHLLGNGSSLGPRRRIFPFGRLDRPPRNLTGGQNRNHVSDFPGRVFARHGWPSPRLHQIVLGYLHDPDILRDNPRSFVVDRLTRRSRLFRLDNALNLNDFPASGVRAADVLALKLWVELISLLAIRADDSDVHG
jgi:hypothetical protein